jgi:hypothetical protein
MFNNRDLYRQKILIVKASFFSLHPGQCKFIEFEYMLDELDFFGPEKAVRIESKFIEALLSEAFAGCKVRWMCQKWWEREERVFGDAVDGAEFFRECCGDWLNFLVNSLVLEREDAGIGRWKQQESMSCGRCE